MDHMPAPVTVALLLMPTGGHVMVRICSYTYRIERTFEGELFANFAVLYLTAKVFSTIVRRLGGQ